MAKSDKKRSTPRQHMPKRGARSSSSRRSLAGSINSASTQVTKQEAEDTLQVMLDLLAPPIMNYSCVPSASSSSTSSGKVTPCSSHGGSSSSSRNTSPNKRRLSPNSPTNYLQIGHDGQVKTCAFPSSPQSAFVPISQQQQPDAAAGGPVVVVKPMSPQSPGREPPGHYAAAASSKHLDVVLEYSAHSHSLRDTSTHSSPKRSSHSRLSLPKRKQVSFANLSQDDDSTLSARRSLPCWCMLTPPVFFLLGCCLYVTTAFLRVKFFVSHQDVPMAILNADDDALLWDYYNRTLGIPISQEDWASNNRPFLDDDHLVVVNIEGEDVPVSKYQLVAFCAALCFLVTGVWQVCIEKGPWNKAPYAVMVVAAGLGVASSMLLEYDGYLAKVLYATSVHVFAVQAISLVVIHSTERDNDENGDHTEQRKETKEASVVSQSSETVRNLKDKMVWSVAGDGCLLVGTLMDVFLSYFCINNSIGIQHAYASVVAAAFWLVASVLYISVAAREYRSLVTKESSDSSISSQESNNKNNNTLDTGNMDDDEESLFVKGWLKGTPLADEMDGENSIVSEAPAPFDEVRSL